MWQAMLLSAGLSTSKQVLIHGFITSGNQKMSKSLGNIIDPLEMVAKYGTDPLRYYLLSEIRPFEDGDFTTERFAAKYNADLANGLGNLVARVTTLIEKNNLSLNLKPGSDTKLIQAFSKKIEQYKFDEALKVLWHKLRACDESITKTQPWKMKKADEVKQVLEPIAQNLLNVAELLQPFMPTIAKKIIDIFTAKKITKAEPLFPRVMDK
jgi:methionyl-tRNA synthetase